MTEQELLAVLDMSEDEQFKWLLDKDITDGSLAVSQVTNKVVSSWIRIEFADLAFRLRDEVIAKDDESEIDCNWCEASYEVYLYVIGEENEEKAKEGLDTWFTMRAKPIHWIIAALIVKDKEDENNT